MKLNQLIAILNGVKRSAETAKTEIYKLVQKPALFQGQQRTYTPRREDGYVYPEESQKLTLKAEDLIEQFAEAGKEYLNLAATQDWANTEAKASVKVDNDTILENVPVPHLLFLEKQLLDMKTFISSLPTLPIDKEWDYDAAKGCYTTTPKESVKTKKVVEFVKVFEPTPHHPGQAKEVPADIIEGTWTLVELSGAIAKDRQTTLLRRVETLYQAVLKAREEANSLAVTQQNTAEKITKYLFSP